jgi:acyl-CoA dehydrogenase
VTAQPAPTTPEELDLFREQTRRLIAKEFVPQREKWLEQRKVDREAWRVAGAAGLLGASMPTEYGGAGGDYRHEAVIAEELAKAGLIDFAIPLHNAIIVPYVLHYGSEEQKREWMPKLCNGERVSAICMTEPGTGSDLQAVKTSAKRDGNHYVINGQKTFISSGQNADLIIVVAKTDPTKGAKGTSLIVVEPDNVDGFRRGRNLQKIGQKASDTSELFFDDVRVPTSNLLGREEGQGFIQLMQQLPQERLTIAVQSLALMEYAVEETVRYTKERKAFGKNLLDFQNTRFKLAECATEAKVGRAFVDDCIAKHVEGKLDAATASMAKMWLSERCCEVADTCLQMHGGYGYMFEYPISRIWTDARVGRIYGGTNEIMRELIARSL